MKLHVLQRQIAKLSQHKHHRLLHIVNKMGSSQSSRQEIKEPKQVTMSQDTTQGGIHLLEVHGIGWSNAILWMLLGAAIVAAITYYCIRKHNRSWRMARRQDTHRRIAHQIMLQEMPRLPAPTTPTAPPAPAYPQPSFFRDDH